MPLNLSRHFSPQSQVIIIGACANSYSAGKSWETLSDLWRSFSMQHAPLPHSALQTLLTLAFPFSPLCLLKPWVLSGFLLLCCDMEIPSGGKLGLSESPPCLFPTSELLISYCLMYNVLETIVSCILFIYFLMFAVGE